MSRRDCSLRFGASDGIFRIAGLSRGWGQSESYPTVMKHAFTTLSFALLITGAKSAVVAQWDFNAVADKLNASTGSGVAIPLGTTSSFASDTSNGGSSDPNAVGTGNGGGGWGLTAFPAQSADSGTEGARFDASTVGYAFPGYLEMHITFDLRLSNTAGRWYRLDHSTDGGSNWTLGTATSAGTGGNLGDQWHNGQTVVLTDPAVFNNPAFAFRVVSVFNPDAFTQFSGTIAYAADSAYEVARNPSTGTTSGYAGTGTWRLDMVTVTAVPEPSVALLGGIGLLALLRRERRGA